MDWIVALLIIAPAAVLLAQRSTWLMDYFVWVTVLNRGIRRYVDWRAHQFNPLSLISLTPLIIGGFVAVLVFLSIDQIPKRVAKILLFLGAALSIGFLVGLFQNRLAAIYAFAEYIGPLSVMAMAFVHGRDDRVFDRWVKTIGWAALVVSLYGWYQYFVIPPWDAFWVEAVGFIGYLGQLRPTEMTVFSTMSERGPCAFFLAWAVIPMFVTHRWRNPLRWVAVLIIVGTILVTYVRSALILVALAAVVFPLVNKGKGMLRIVAVTITLFIGINLLLPNLGIGHAQVQQRLSTFGNLTEDDSFKGRLEIAESGFAVALRNPLGTGLGSVGLAGRANSGTMQAEAVVGDNGYFELILPLGWIGSVLFFYALYNAWKQVRRLEALGLQSEITMTTKAMFIVGGIILYVSNWLNGPASIVFWILLGRALVPALRPDQLARLNRILPKVYPRMLPHALAPQSAS